MPTITVKNIPSDLYEKLKHAAEVNRRSINSEILICIEQVVSSRPFNPDQTLAGARLLRMKTAAHSIGDSEFNQAKTANRP
jgi:antitoxin FitA